MKAAVVFYSMGGNTAYAAREIAKILGADVLEIRPVKQYPDRGLKKFLWGGKGAVMAETPALVPYSFDAGAYDTVVVGFPVWASNIAPPVRSFAAAEGQSLAGKRIAAFACQGGSGGEKALSRLEKLLPGEKLAARLVLDDPKDRPKPGDLERIRDFCALCAGGADA